MDKTDIQTSKQTIDTRHKKGNPTLCWACRYATGLPIETYTTPDGATKTFACPWATKHKPVCGWTAVHTEFGTGADHVESYYVEKCPLYQGDLMAQISHLSNEELSRYISIPAPSVNAHRKAAEWLLYACITQRDYLIYLLAKRDGAQILEAAGKEFASPNPLSETNISDYGPVEIRIRDAALKYAIRLMGEDAQESESDHEERYLRDLSLLARVIVKERKAAANREKS